MILGLYSAILGELSLEEVFKIAKINNLKCIEVACWPAGKSERKYAGVCHIDINNYNKREILQLQEEYDISISALSYYPNLLDEDENIRRNSYKHLIKVIEAAKDLNIELVNTFIGRNHKLSLEDNFSMIKKIWTPILNKAEELDIRIGIENCPMLFTEDEWPGGKNIMTSPRNWRRIFEILNSDNLGLNYDPSHFILQQMNYIKPIYEFKDKIFHIHFKDLKIYKDKLDEIGIFGLPLEYMEPKIPGLGDIDWAKYCSALYDIEYKGYGTIEIEDSAFENSIENKKKSIQISTRYLNNFIE